jgi:hypothetical protein
MKPQILTKYLNPFGIGKTFELMNTNNLSVHVLMMIFITEIRKKKLTKNN